MRKEAVERLLMEIQDFARVKNLSRREMAQKLDIPFNSYRMWFHKGRIRRKPSPAYIEKIEKFLESHKETDTYWRELWQKVLRWWETQHRYRTVKDLASEIGWNEQNLTIHLLNKEQPSNLVIEKLAKTIGLEVPSVEHMLPEAQRKTKKIEYLLLILEDELRWFRDSSKEAREVFRSSLDLNDVGYITSLLTMLGDEDKFKRWVTLTTSRFNFFKHRSRRR